MRFKSMAPAQPKTIMDTDEGYCYTAISEENADRLLDLLNGMHDELEFTQGELEFTQDLLSEFQERCSE